MSNKADLTGIRFGFLTVSTRAGKANRHAIWHCLCDCGQRTVGRADRLLNGRHKACNINGHRAGGEKRHEYRMGDLPEYRVWCGMRERCRDPKHHHWKNYGGRGIRVCVRWDVSFEAFLSDMGPRPPGGTIERKNVNGNYEPDNCRWASMREQSRNKRTSRFVIYNDRKVLLVDLAEELGLKYMVLVGRLNAGWSLADAIAKPVRAKRRNGTLLTAPPAIVTV